MSEPHLTEQQSAVLRELGRIVGGGPLGLDRIAERTGSHWRSTQVRLFRLEELGLVSVNVSGWRITPSGREVLERMGGVK